MCEGSTILSVVFDAGILTPEIASDFTYQWSTNEKTPTITVSKEGEYTVIVTNKSGCTALHKSILSLSYLAKINSIIIKDLRATNNIIIDVINPSDYQYMLQFENGTSTPFQNSPIFENVPGGFHELKILNKNFNCEYVTRKVAVLDAPKFFTPNNDGINDYWNLNGISSSYYKNAVVYIFDRYGKLLKQISPSSKGWDGIYNGFPLASDDYWFSVKLEDGREARGHFSLKRQ